MYGVLSMVCFGLAIASIVEKIPSFFAVTIVLVWMNFCRLIKFIFFNKICIF